MKIKKWIFEKQLPIYFRFWPTQYWLAIWCAPARYIGNEDLPSRNDSYWKALRITVRKGSCHSELVCVLKEGTWL